MPMFVRIKVGGGRSHLSGSRLDAHLASSKGLYTPSEKRACN